jgi:hypothetical protein
VRVKRHVMLQEANADASAQNTCLRRGAPSGVS